jgi:nucleoside-diphosphate-sugar epimerase
MASMGSEKVLVTGGASFIGSHLVDTLLKKGKRVVVADDFSSGKLTNLEYPFNEKQSGHWTAPNLEVVQGDLKEKSFTTNLMKDVDVVFHLAALHGGRGYIDTHPAECGTNMILRSTCVRNGMCRRSQESMLRKFSMRISILLAG